MSTFEQLLRERLQRALDWEAELAEQIATLGGMRDANNDDEHDPDGVPVSAEWSRLAGLLHESRAQQTEIHAALVRIERGEYGVCTRCGRRIPDARLEVRPMAELCVDCAS